MFTFIGIGVGVVLLSFTISALVQYARYGEVSFAPPEKRTYLFEDEDGNRENPLTSEEGEDQFECEFWESEQQSRSSQSDWKYDPQEFDD